jgi:hypothetical protein
MTTLQTAKSARQADQARRQVASAVSTALRASTFVQEVAQAALTARWEHIFRLTETTTHMTASTVLVENTSM